MNKTLQRAELNISQVTVNINKEHFRPSDINRGKHTYGFI